MVKPLSLNHLNLPAKDPPSLRKWYVDKLGFKERNRFLWSAGTLIVFSQGEPLARSDYHFGFRVLSLEELTDWADTLRRRGVDVGEIEGDESYSTFYIEDPEGNTIEVFYEPVPEFGDGQRLKNVAAG